MALVTLDYLMKKAMKGNYAIGAFNFFTYENLIGIGLAAQRKNSPVIAMASVGAMKIMGEKGTVGACYGVARDYDVDMVLHLDHATDYDLIRRCVDNGFTSVMIDASSKVYQENVDITAQVVEYAAKYGVSVEAELGHVGGQEDHIKVDEREALFTVPEDAKRFIKDTGVDALAIAVGTVHGFYKSEPKLDFPRIARIHELVPTIPLVLHGGTGVSDDDFKKAIQLGVRKINVGTELKVHGVFDVSKQAYASDSGSDPRSVSVKVIEACAKIVESRIDVIGSVGKL
ncbi:fructose-bisphosphate aldolase, class II [Sphaerochaeta associata]|uniref:Class II fructose-bisphosphate aldolase n=1 Tax=Sphaerochaeta associata TaxID=1129264 RepID=A0ABY4DGV3_9SPIR|nr:class II fructose-bisphosphate aldolase [Sphaerochaeta associata]UOM51096.1 class II fructose-bisphosphate aldolase [Sphaerochaeta associata]SMP56468.1 fructose-bisphosphate aldolase, class II [Sphaerochaeta associata]